MPTMSRQALFDLVWADPVKTVAVSLGCSDVWLKKCCTASDIPVPDRGYWAKLRAGKPVLTRRLPPRRPGMPDQITIGGEPSRWHWPIDPERELAEPEPVQPEFAEPIEEVEARVAKEIGRAKLHHDLDAPHPAIRRLLEEDHKRRTKPADAPYRLKWAEPFFDSPFEKRRLRLLNSLLLAFAKAGLKSWISDEDSRLTGVTVGAQQVYFMLDHPGAKRDRDNRYRSRPGKVDTLRYDLANGRRLWTDTADDKLEGHLTELVVETITEGERQLRRNAQQAFERACERRREMEELLRKRREEAERKEREARLAAERARQKSLLRMARDRRRAQEIRELIDAVRARAAEGASDAGAFEEWASWAANVAARLDPLDRMSFAKGGSVRLSENDLPQAGEPQDLVR